MIFDVDGGFEDTEIRAFGALRAIGAKWFDGGGGGWFESFCAGVQDEIPLRGVVSASDIHWALSDFMRSESSLALMRIR